jgi:uncharacterized protein
VTASPGAIDVVVGLYTPEVVRLRPAWGRDFFGDKIGVGEGTLGGVTLDEYIARMDRAGIARSFLAAVRAGPAWDPISFHLPYEMVADAVRQHPDRFLGLAGVDPSAGMRGVREMERAITELGFVGAHLYPHWFGMEPDDRRLYPFYAKCIDLDVPIQMQVGHCLRYSSERPLRSTGRPIALDTVACDLPELKVIGIHVGWPWTEEMIAVAYKHPNVYIGGDAYAPKHWPAPFVHYLNTFGQDKVVFGTDFPVIDPERAMREIGDLNLRPVPRQKLLRDNALRLYGLAA